MPDLPDSGADFGDPPVDAMITPLDGFDVLPPDLGDPGPEDLGLPPIDMGEPDMPPVSDGGIRLPDDVEPLPEECQHRTAAPCLCPDGSEGVVFCEGTDWLPSCECAPEPWSPDVSEDCREDQPEWCDAMDNDCDGIVDEGHVCPSMVLDHTLPAEGTVWAQNVRPGRSPELARLWPVADHQALAGFDREEGIVRSALDGTFFHIKEGSGTFLLRESASDVPLSFPPCGLFADFERLPNGETVYRCDSTLRRNNGMLITEDIDPETQEWLAATVSGRVVLASPGGMPNLFVVERNGSVRDLGRPYGDWEGSLAGRTRATVAGESVFFASYRVFSGRVEAVIHRLDADTGSVFLVRRMPIVHVAADGIALPDGRFFAREDESLRYSRIAEYPPRGAAREHTGFPYRPVYQPNP